MGTMIKPQMNTDKHLLLDEWFEIIKAKLFIKNFWVHRCSSVVNSQRSFP